MIKNTEELLEESYFPHLPRVKESYRKCFNVATNDAPYQVRIQGPDGKTKTCPYYRTWSGFVRAIYLKSQYRPSYEGCSVSDEWLTFMNFRAWMEEQNWKGKSISRGILYPDNKIYCAEKCYFIDGSLQQFFSDYTTRKAGHLPVGVVYYPHTKKLTYRAQVGAHGGIRGHSSTHRTIEEAFAKVIEVKIEILDNIIKVQTDKKLIEGLKRHRVSILNRRIE